MAGTDRPARGEAALLAALVAGRTVVDAAKLAGVSESTGRRLVATPRVAQALRERRSQALDEAVTLLSVQATRAAEVLADLAEHALQEQVRLAAASRVIEWALKGRETVDIEARLAALEAQLATQAPTGGGRPWPARSA